MARRWRVIVPGCLIMSGISGFLGLMTMGKTDIDLSRRFILASVMVFFGPLAGPLAEPLGYVDFDPLRTIAATVVLLALIALHPLRPGIMTALVSGAAIAAWFVWGLCVIYGGA